MKNIIIISGHLTAKNKVAVKAILQAGLSCGKVGRKTYVLAENDGLYTVSYQIKDKGLIPVPGTAYRISTYTATFKLK